MSWNTFSLLEDYLHFDCPTNYLVRETIDQFGTIWDLSKSPTSDCWVFWSKWFWVLNCGRFPLFWWPWVRSRTNSLSTKINKRYVGLHWISYVVPRYKRYFYISRRTLRNCPFLRVDWYVFVLSCETKLVVELHWDFVHNREILLSL